MSFETISRAGATSPEGIASVRVFGLTPVALALSLVFIFASVSIFTGAGLADLRAGWMAGEAFARGDSQLIYPPSLGIYTMRPPEEWLAALDAAGFEGAVYPFVYPPLWAWVAAQVTKVSDFETVAVVVQLINATMIVGMLLLARRLAAPRVPQAIYLLAGLLFLGVTSVGSASLSEGQPQIFVALLTLLAIERAERGHPWLAGSALALAASIKLFPALIALLFLARRQYHAAATFAVFGAGFALLSVLVAGWPLHREFLDLLGDISATTLVTPVTYALEGIAAQTLFREALGFVPLAVLPADASGRLGITILAEPPAFTLAFLALQAVALALIAFIFRRANGGKAGTFPIFLWPFALTALALTGPLAWSYYYLAPMAFLPAMFDRIRPRFSLPIFLTATFALSPFARGWITFPAESPAERVFLLQGVGTLSMALLALLFLLIAFRDLRRAAMTARMAV